MLDKSVNDPELWVSDTMLNMEMRLASHNSICVGVSGGSDSNVIVHMIATEFRKYLPKIHFVFSNTGLEYKATLRHLDYMEERYDIKIDRIKPDKGNGVVSVVRREGVPILSKAFSKEVQCAQKGQQWAIKRMYRTKQESDYAYSDKVKKMAHYLLENNIKVSSKCCDLSKKKPYYEYLKNINADLTITGERRCEGGQRATAHKGCFEKGDKHDKYMPLFYWDDKTKKWYKEHEGIVYSDCYEVWGMKRTGCVGCPFNGYIGEDLKIIKKYEPNLYKACMNVFGESYNIMEKFEIHRHAIFTDYDQLSLFD